MALPKWRPISIAILGTLSAVALVVVSLPGMPVAHSATYGHLTITVDTVLTGDHVGDIVIGADDISLDCGGYFVVGDGSGVGVLLEDRTGVEIEDCNVMGFVTGFRLDGSDLNTLTQNTALLNEYGFFFTNSESNELVENTANSNSSSGFDFRQFSGGATLTDNLALNNGGAGFGIAQSLNMTLTGNTATGSTGSIGFSFTATGSNVLEQNIATNNNTGFSLWGSDYALHQNLAAENWTGFSLKLWDSTLTENTASENVSGFSFNLARDNTLLGNTTIDNRNGFVLDVNSSGNSFVHNNIIANTFQVLSDAAADWYDSVELEGNYWSDYIGLDDGSGTGKHAIAGDGIGDTRIPHPGAAFDAYPFVAAFENPLAAVANDDEYSTDEDEELSVAADGVLSNDAGTIGGSLTAVLVSTTGNGLLSLNPDGSFTYEPSPDTCGTDHFTYRADNGYIESPAVTVGITVLCLNDPPVADSGGPYLVDEGDTTSLDATASSDAEDALADLSFAWDLDYQPASPQFDVFGTAPTFDASTIDGPALFDVALRVTDQDGESTLAITTVTVLNLAPGVSVDDPGLLLPGVEFTLSASFEDLPADTHSAVIDWGDSDEMSLSAPIASEFGGQHVYAVAGIYEIEVTVTDDDGDAGAMTVEIEVVDPVTGLGSAIDDLSAAAAAETDPTVAEGLLSALAWLEGHGPAADGALERLVDGDREAAVRKLLRAAQSLDDAIDDGAAEEIRELQRQLAAIAEALARESYAEAILAVDPPSRGEIRQLARLHSYVDDGVAAAALEDYVDAIAAFARAVRLAEDLAAT